MCLSYSHLAVYNPFRYLRLCRPFPLRLNANSSYIPQPPAPSYPVLRMHVLIGLDTALYLNDAFPIYTRDLLKRRRSSIANRDPTRNIPTHPKFLVSGTAEVVAT